MEKEVFVFPQIVQISYLLSEGTLSMVYCVTRNSYALKNGYNACEDFLKFLFWNNFRFTEKFQI